MSTLSSMIVRDVIGSRPTAGIPGRLFFSTDTHAWSRDNGSTWDAMGDLGSIGVTIDGGGLAITTGIKADVRVTNICTITEWTILCDQSGSIVIDVWKDTYANYPPLVGDAITGSAKPTVSSATKGNSSTLTGWTTAIAAGDVLRFNVDSATTVTRATLILKVVKG